MIHLTTFLSFWIFDFINKIEIFHFIHIQGRSYGVKLHPFNLI